MRCIVLLFGIRLPLSPASAHMVAVRCGESASFSSLCLSSSDSLLRPPGALIVAVSPAKRKRKAELDSGNSNAVYETKETDGCQSLLFGIRRLPIFPASAHMVAVRCGESASFSSLCLSSSDSLLRPPGALIVAVSPAKRKRKAELDSGNSNAVYETKETDGCQSLLFGIRRLPIFPGRHQPSIFGV